MRAISTPRLRSRAPLAGSCVKGERGVALIMAMMIVALIAMVAVEVSWRFELSLSRSANRWHGIQARAYLEGAEHLAMVVLKEDLEDEETSKADYLSEPWAQQSAPFPTDHGWVSGRIEDVHGRFNINLMTPEPNTCGNGISRPSQGCPPAAGCDKYTKHQQIFVRLLQTFNLNQGQGQEQNKTQTQVPAEEEPVYLPTDQAEQITEAIIDWLDSDSDVTGFGGAESDYYSGLETPITISNKEMVSVSELQVIRGMIPELYRQLLPYVIALPRERFKIFNINTISANFARSIKTDENCTLEPYDEEFGEQAHSFLSGGDFVDWQGMKDDSLVGLPLEWGSGDEIKIQQDLFGFGPSEYFLLYSETGIGEDHVRRGLSLIRRSSQAQQGGQNAGQGPTIEVVRRSDANFNQISQ